MPKPEQTDAKPNLTSAQETLDHLWEDHVRDQASVLVQIGLLDAANLPVVGIESARKVLDPSLPGNELMKRNAPS